MRLLSTTTLCLLCPLLASAREETAPPFAVLDSGGHTAAVGQVLFAPDGQTLYSVSVDRTIRVWDVRLGRTRAVLRPPFSGELFGQLSRAALSPDGRLLAAAGNTTQNETTFEIYLIALHPRTRMYHVLKGHTDAITAVCFSPDGEQLATGSLDKTVRLWTVASGEGRVLETGKERVTGLAFSSDGKALAVATPAGGRILSVDRSKPDISLRGSGTLHDIAFRRDDKTIAAACASPPSLELWNVDGSFRKRLTLPGTPLGCRFVAADRVLATLRVAKGDGSLCQYGAVLLDLERGADKPPILGPLVERRFVSVETEAGCAAYAEGEDLLALAGGNDPAITLYKGRDGRRLRVLAGIGSAIWSVGWGYTGQTLAWGDEGKYEDFRRNGTRPLRYTFSFARLELGPFADPQYQYARQAPDNPPVEGCVTSGLFYKRSSRVLAELFAARAGVSLPGDKAAVASPIRIDGRQPFAAHGVAVRDLSSGRELYRLQGHQGIVNTLSLSRDQRYLLSGSEDQTVRVWKLGPERRLLLSLFRGGDDWVAWTPDGCYAASSSGARLFGWQVNRRDQLARFYPAADVQPSRLLPSVVKQLLRRGGVQEAIAAAKSVGETVALLPIEKVLPPEADRLDPAKGKPEKSEPEKKQAGKKGAPVVRIRLRTPHHDGMVEKAEVTVEVEATDTGGGVQKPRLKSNGSFLAGADDIKKAGLVLTCRFTVDLIPGDNPIEATAKSADGVESEPAILVVRYEKPLSKPDLYLLAVGVSAYKDLQLRKGVKYAAADARALAEVFKRRGVKGGLYREVHVDRFLLLDDKATREGIVAALKEIGDKARKEDVFVLFLAGHGEKTESRYFYIPYEFEGKTTNANLERQGLSIDDLKDKLKRLRAKKRLLILDTCHSGAAVSLLSSGVKSPAAVMRGVLEQLQRAQGVHTLAAVSAEMQSKEHDELKHGLFTYALLAGLHAVEGGPLHKKGIPGNVVDVRQLCNFVCDEAPTLYQEYDGRRQDPVMKVTGGGMNFPLLPARDP
ncbi:MAG TPA: caspase family protein [Gemmataceae bacterium]|nr:caspase family protein [Gemmataceae bacterium]